MHRFQAATISGVLLGLLALRTAGASAAGYGAAGGGTVSAASAMSVTPSAGVQVSHNALLGPILVTSSGMTLYTFKNDTLGHSNCTGGCATIWPPLLTSGAPTAGPGASGALSVVSRAGGAQQVAYNGWPLYTYAGDVRPGQTNGQGLLHLWYVVGIKAAAASGATTVRAASTAALPKTGGGRALEGLGILLLAGGTALLGRKGAARGRR